MAYQLQWTAVITWIPDGAGQMGVPSAQSLTVTSGSNVIYGGDASQTPVQVPGGDSPTSANITTACTTAGTNMSTVLTAAATLARIQGWATGSN